MSQLEAPSNNKKGVLAGDFRWGVRAYPAEEPTTMITPLRKLYQHHADDCLRVAELADDPRRRERISSWRASGLRRPRRLELMRQTERHLEEAPRHRLDRRRPDG